MESTVYKPSIYNAPTIYKNGGGGGGGGGGEIVEIGSKTYPVITIGSQKWIGLNLDYVPAGVNVGGSGEIYTPNAWYYNNNETFYGWNNKKYGLLYNFAAVQIVNASLPDGWRVPSKADFESLITYLGGYSEGKKIRSPYDWTGSDSLGENLYGFSLFPSGLRWGHDSWQHIGTSAYLATTTLSGSYYTYQLNLTSYTFSFISINKASAFAIRLIKDV